MYMHVCIYAYKWTFIEHLCEPASQKNCQHGSLRSSRGVTIRNIQKSSQTECMRNPPLLESSEICKLKSSTDPRQSSLCNLCQGQQFFLRMAVTLACLQALKCRIIQSSSAITLEQHHK